MKHAALLLLCLLLTSCGGGIASQQSTSSKPATVVFIGDSITQFWDLSVSFPGKPYINKGIIEQTSADVLARFQADTANADVVVLLVGVNDLLFYHPESTLASNVSEMVRLAQSSKKKIVLATLLPVASDISVLGQKYANHDFNPEIREHNAWLKSFASGNGITLVDYQTVIVGPDGYPLAGMLTDGVHPSLPAMSE